MWPPLLAARRFPGLFVIFYARNAGPAAEFIFVHAFRLRSREIYARPRARTLERTLKRLGIIHTLSRGRLDEELTTCFGYSFFG